MKGICWWAAAALVLGTAFSTALVLNPADGDRAEQVARVSAVGDPVAVIAPLPDYVSNGSFYELDGTGSYDTDGGLIKDWFWEISLLNDFATRVMTFLVELSAKFGAEGTPMHDLLAMGVAIDPSFVEAKHMRIHVETRGEFTRGATVGNRYNMVERNELKGDRYVMTGIDTVEPNARVAVGGDAERFMTFFIDRLAGK